MEEKREIKIFRTINNALLDRGREKAYQLAVEMAQVEDVNDEKGFLPYLFSLDIMQGEEKRQFIDAVRGSRV